MAPPRQLARLPRRRDFLRVAAARKKWGTPGLVLQAAPNPEGGDTVRVGFTVTRKVGNAVIRNRARRRLRAAADAILRSRARAGLDYVLIGRHGTLDRPWPALLEDLALALRRLRAYVEDGGGAKPPPEREA